MTTGHCECGKIRFEFSGEIVDFSHCHCSQCRRLHGAAFGSYAGVADASFRFVSGESELRTYPSSVGSDRAFCGTCGSNILVRIKSDPKHVYICMGVVNGQPALPPAYHQFTGSRAYWYDITDGLEQFSERPPE